ncbi:MAG: sulfhydrogenase subunit delta [Gammaproteobacteria bacterium]|nr:MAG: sulfhydrogenase subunit delta [Gammaproteobacteria bacterium]
MKKPQYKIKIAVHKFSSCDGCQLAFLNAVGDVLKLSDWIDIVHFAEAGPCNPLEKVDIAFIEGSVSTREDEERLKTIRQSANKIVSIGACATTGGLQALRNLASHDDWVKAIYAQPEYITTLAQSTAISEHVHVNHELQGCPVNSRQLFSAIEAWLNGHEPEKQFDTVCTECKRKGNNCVMITKQLPCMGPVTRCGCDAICPSFNRECYGCYGPSDLCNTESLAKGFAAYGLSQQDIANRFHGINSHGKAFLEQGKKHRDQHD